MKQRTRFLTYTILSVASCLLLTGMTTACSGSSNNKTTDEAEDGLLPSEQLDILDIGARRWELNYKKQDAKTAEEYYELEEAEKEAAEQWSEACKELKGVTVATEVAEDVPAELVKPFTLKPGGNVVEMSATIKLTIDRPRVTDRHFHPSDYYYIKMATIGADGQTTDTIDVWSPISYNVESSFSAGDELEVRTGINLRDMAKTAPILKAKKLRIIWEHPVQEQVADIVRGDLGIFNLRGPVQSCEWKGLYDTWTLYFDAEGRWTSERGRGTFNQFPTIKRDSQGRIIKLTNGDESLTYEYNADGLLKKHTAQYMDGGSESTYEYDVNGDCIKEVSSYGGMDMEEDEGPTVSNYTVTKRDDHGNWTERKDQHGNVERRDIHYMP